MGCCARSDAENLALLRSVWVLCFLGLAAKTLRCQGIHQTGPVILEVSTRRLGCNDRNCGLIPVAVGGWWLAVANRHAEGSGAMARSALLELITALSPPVSSPESEPCTPIRPSHLNQ